MKSIVIYDSASGFTKRYGEWISEELSSDCRALSDVDAQKLAQYDCVLFGSHVLFGDISNRKKISRLSKNLKNVLVFAVGAAPLEHNPMIPAIFGKIDKSMPQLKGKTHYYFRGGIKSEALPGKEKIALRIMLLFMKLMNSIKPSPVLKNVIAMMNEDHDESSREYIAPLIDYVKNDFRSAPQE